MERKTSVYGLIDPRDNKVKYIGVSVDTESRYRSHLREVPKSSSKTLKDFWVEHLRNRNKRPKLIVFGSYKTTQEAKTKEKELILEYSDKRIIYNISHNPFFIGSWVILRGELVKTHRLYKTLIKSIKL